MQQSKLSLAAEFAMFAAVSLPTLSAIRSEEMSGWAAIAWCVAFVCFGSAFAAGALSRVFATQRRRIGASLLFAMTLCGLAMLYTTFFSPTTYVAALTLLVTARRLPYVASQRTAWLETSGMAVASVAIIFWFDGWRGVLLGGTPTVAMLIFVVGRSLHDLREQAVRTELALTNAELLASRELLAETSRTAERLRISRDLHDALGHHLAALSIQLDVAARRSEGAAADHIREAHAITRLLLGDVRDAVARLRQDADLNVATLIAPFCRDIGDLRIHLEIAEAATANDTKQAELIVRCVQEAITNTLKHAQARNLWVRIAQDDSGIDIQAHDDGRGVESMKLGHGLTGMRERFAQHGGRVDVTSGTTGGFGVHAMLPRREGTS
jgi:signal transduction histidine kinase